MHSHQVCIVDLGRGPQIKGSRLTVLDVFYYLHRGYDFALIRQAMPSLTREQFDAVVAYVHKHHADLVEQDRRAEEFHQRGIDAQHTRGGVFAASVEDQTTAERAARLKEAMERKLAEKSGGGRPDCST